MPADTLVEMSEMDYFISLTSRVADILKSGWRLTKQNNPFHSFLIFREPLN